MNLALKKSLIHNGLIVNEKQFFSELKSFMKKNEFLKDKE